MLLDDFAAFVVFIDEHFSGFDLGYFGVRDPLDVPIAEFVFEQTAGIADAAQAQMADIGFAGDEGHWDLIADIVFAQRRVEDRGIFVSRSETTGKLHSADHDRAGVGEQFLEIGIGFLGVVDGAHRLGETTRRAGARDFIEGQPWPGGDEQIIVADFLTILEDQLVRGRVDLLHPAGDEVDAMFFQHRFKWQRDGLAGAPADRKPGIGRGELEGLAGIDHGNRMLFIQDFT